MKRAFAALAAAALLAGCGALQKLEGAVTQDRLDVARATYDSLLTAAAQYNERPRCAPGQDATLANLCSEYTAVVKLRAVDASVAASFDQVQADLNACDPGKSGVTTQAAGTCSSLSADYDALAGVLAVARTATRQITGASI
jgi:hypothetical protein